MNYLLSRTGTTPAFPDISAGTTRHTRSNPMAWVYLAIAGLFEMGWAIGLKYTEGFTRPIPTILTIAAMVISIGLLGLALRDLPVGTGYAVWTGIGTVGTALLGMYLFGDPATAARLACIGLIIAGIAGLKFLT
jgi:quaternary ammonium compound-resistance protein SugE